MTRFRGILAAMLSSRHIAPTAALAGLALGLALACGDPGPGGEHAGQACVGIEDCYPDADHAELRGEVACLDNVTGGYCTHRCESDADCCAVPGECASHWRQVCSPFTNDETKHCMLACEDTDIGDKDADDYCIHELREGWGCASSGGGSENRKICKPK